MAPDARSWKLQAPSQAYAVFRSRDYLLLLIGNSLSAFGLQMLWVAVSWDLYQVTHSPLVLGNVGLVQVAPFLLFALFAGHIADRYNRRYIMLATQCLFLLSSVVLAEGKHSVTVIYACLFLNASARSFQGPSRLALLPLIIPKESLGNAIAWNSSAQEIASVSGPALAGLLMAWQGSRLVYIVQACCALLTFLCYLSLRYRPEPIEPSNVPAGKAIVEGVEFVWNNKLILSAISLDLFAVLFGGATALLPIYAVEVLHGGVHSLAWLRAAPSVGAVSMAVLQAHLPRVRQAGKAMLWGVAGFGLATIVFGISKNFWLSFVMLVFTGVCDNISVVLRQSLVQIETPDRVRGRVLAVNNIFISCSNQLGAVESGLAAAWVGAVPSVVLGGIATVAIVGAYAGKAGPLRRWRQ